MVVEPSERVTIVLLNVAVKIFPHSVTMEMRALLEISGKMCAWRAVRVMCGKGKKLVWVDRMVAPLGRPKRIP